MQRVEEMGVSEKGLRKEEMFVLLGIFWFVVGNY